MRGWEYICRIAAAGLLSLGMTADGSGTMNTERRVNQYSGSWLTYALLSSADSGTGEPLEAEWVVAGTRLEATSVVERIDVLPKPVHCVATKHGRKLRIECKPLPQELQPEFALSAARLRSGSSFVGRLMALGDAPVILRIGSQAPVRVPASLLGRWTEEFLIDPRPDFARREPSLGEAESGVAAEVLVKLYVDRQVSGFERH